MEYYSVAKENEILKLTGKWMELKNILNEVTLVQEDKYHIL